MLQSVVFPIGIVLLVLALVAAAIVAVLVCGTALCGGLAGCVSLLRERIRHPRATRA